MSSTKTKVIIMATSLIAFITIGSAMMLFKTRDNDKPTWRNWWDCNGIGNSLDRESEYSIIYNTCVTLRVNEDGTTTKVMANLDIGLEQ